jgi:dienelactone hydrolase
MSKDYHLCCPTDRPGYAGTMREFKGETITLSKPYVEEPMQCYISPSQSGHWLVVIYDIFGLHPNKYELADWLAAHKQISVAVPDVRRGKNWPIDQYPPPDEETKKKFYKYLESDANPSLRSIEVKATIDFLMREKGAETVSLLGLCWGAKVAALIDSYNGRVKCVIGAHPSFLKSEDGEKATVPILMMPCKEDNLTVYLTGCLKNPNPSLFTISQDYIGTFHGFLGARGRWHLAEESPFVEQAKQDISQFVLSHVNAKGARTEVAPTCCHQLELLQSA